MGEYIKDTGLVNILVETENYGNNSVKIIMDGGHYSRPKKGFPMLAEALNVLRLLVLQKSDDYARNNNSYLADKLDEIHLQISQHCYDKDSVKATKSVWQASTRL